MKYKNTLLIVSVCSVAFITYAWLYTASERPYSEIKSDYINQGNIDEKFGFIMGLNKIDFLVLFTNPSFIGDILVPIGNCASSADADSERCQALLVAIIRKTGEQALSYYAQYAQLMGVIKKPYQIVRVLQDMYANDPKKIAKALYQLVVANPALAFINFNGDVADFGLMQYVLLRYAATVIANPMDQAWLPLLQATVAYWQKNADNAMRVKIIDFSAPGTMALAKLDDFEVARAKAVNPSALLTTEGLAAALGIKI